MALSVPHDVTVYNEVERVATGTAQPKQMTLTAPLWATLTDADVNRADSSATAKLEQSFGATHQSIPRTVLTIGAQTPRWGAVAGRLVVLIVVTIALAAIVSAATRSQGNPAADSSAAVRPTLAAPTDRSAQ